MNVQAQRIALDILEIGVTVCTSTTYMPIDKLALPGVIVSLEKSGQEYRLTYFREFNKYWFALPCDSRTEAVALFENARKTNRGFNDAKKQGKEVLSPSN